MINGSTESINVSFGGADRGQVPAEYIELQRATTDMYEAVSQRRDEIAENDRAATIFASVEETYAGYNEVSAGADPDGALATLRHINWGLRAVSALIDGEPLPTLVGLPEPDRWAYPKMLIVAGSFGLLVAILLYEFITRI